MKKDPPETPEGIRLEWPLILDKISERHFELVVHLVRQHYGVDNAFLSLADRKRQRIKASQGLDLIELDPAAALCEVVVQHAHPLVVSDASRDPRFKESQLVAGPPYIRFCAGVPIRAPNGLKVGTLCLSNTIPRQFDGEDLEVLQRCAGLIENDLAAYTRVNDEQNRRDQLLNRSIGKAQNVFLATDDDHAAFDILLDDLLLLTGSAFGFIGEVLDNESGQPYVEVRTVTNIAWNDDTARLYSQVKQGGLAFRNLDNLIGAAVLTRDIVISDDVPNDHRRGGTGAGHPPISTYIGIPIFFGGRVVGLIGLANCPGGYSREFAQGIEPLTRTVGTLIERKHLYTERAQEHEQAQRAANYDLLTQLPNRRLFSQLVDEKISQVTVKGCSLSVCYIDLDDFKAINDTYGHEAGDTMLQNIANRLSGAVGTEDVVARFSGDEFAVLLQDVDDSSAYQQILECIEQPISYNGQLLKLSGSMGVTLYPADNSDHAVLLRHADQAMYAAKELGKNQFSLFDSGQHRLRRENYRIVEDFKRALSENELELFYQPKIDLHQSVVVGFEALIRWRHPKEGVLAPAQFLPALAGTDQEIQLGEYVISESVKTIQRFSETGADYSLSINISAQHILHDDFLAVLEEKTRVLPPERRANLCIEVLESMALKDIDLSIQILAGCKRLGINLSLDDFGTGFSSLSYFRKLPIDEVKIDKSFVMEMLNDPNDRIIVQNIVNLAKGFNRKVVGEGVETLEIAEALIKMGCDLAQGYHFAKPLPLEEALDWVRNFKRR